MPFNFEYSANSTSPKKNLPAGSKESPSGSGHTGEWRDVSLSNRSYYCCIPGTPSSKDGMPCQHYGLSSPRSVISSSHWSCCGALSKDSFCGEVDAGAARKHRYSQNGSCKICWGCATCTGFGKRCCRVKGQDRDQERGGVCGCGNGCPGCLQCGLCKSCCKESGVAASGVCKGPLHLPIGAKIFCEWRREGGQIYAGIISDRRLDAETGQGGYDVRYDDGDFDQDVGPIRIHVSSPEAQGDASASSSAKGGDTMAQRLSQLMSVLTNDSLLTDPAALPFLLGQSRGIRELLLGGALSSSPTSSTDSSGAQHQTKMSETPSQRGGADKMAGHERKPLYQSMPPNEILEHLAMHSLHCNCNSSGFKRGLFSDYDDEC